MIGRFHDRSGSAKPTSGQSECGMAEIMAVWGWASRAGMPKAAVA